MPHPSTSVSKAGLVGLVFARQTPRVLAASGPPPQERRWTPPEAVELQAMKSPWLFGVFWGIILPSYIQLCRDYHKTIIRIPIKKQPV